LNFSLTFFAIAIYLPDWKFFFDGQKVTALADAKVRLSVIFTKLQTKKSVGLLLFL